MMPEATTTGNNAYEIASGVLMLNYANTLVTFECLYLNIQKR